MIKIRVTPEQSEQVQKIALDNGYVWKGTYAIDNQMIVKNTDKPFLILHLGYIISLDNEEIFEALGGEETEVDYFISKNKSKLL